MSIFVNGNGRCLDFDRNGNPLGIDDLKLEWGVHSVEIEELWREKLDGLQEELENDGIAEEAVPAIQDAILEAYSRYSGWRRTDNWMSSQPIGAWHGVTVDDETGRVTELSFSDNNLRGELPIQLGDLTDLQMLDLSFNRLEGELPTELESLAKLESANFSSNQFEGEIPSEWGKLIKDEGGSLEHLDLFDNDLSGCIPRDLMKPLEDGLPDSQEALFHYDTSRAEWILKEVILRFAPGEALDDATSIGLGWAIAYNSYIKPTYGLWLPPCPPAAPNMAAWWSGQDVLDPGSDFWSGVQNILWHGGSPTDPTDKGVLTALYLSTGGRDWKEANKKNWIAVFQDLDEWEGVETETIGGKERVVSLNLASTNLTGKIPAALGSLEHLRYLNLSRNNLSGPIPEELGNLKNLEVLALNENNLSGPIPEELGNLRKLSMLNLYDNPYLGIEPLTQEQLENLDKLQEQGIFFDAGPVVGNRTELPEELGNITYLEHLKIQNTGLTGCIPLTLADNFGKTPFATDVVSSLLSYGIGIAVGSVTPGGVVGYALGIVVGEITGWLVSTIVNPLPFFQPGAPSPIPWVGSDLGNVKLYCE